MLAGQLEQMAEAVFAIISIVVSSIVSAGLWLHHRKKALPLFTDEPS
ncbi:hypothetical protein ACFXHD_23150 [Streptomyces hydrogenans]